jgi:hypothetical protein
MMPDLPFGNNRRADDDRVIAIAVNGNGRGLRGLTGRKAYGSASLVIPKSGHAMLVEASAEPLWVRRHLFDCMVKTIKTQPFRIEMTIAGRKSVYFPDMLVEYVDGRRVVEEHKASVRQLRDPAYRHKVAVAARGLALHGMEMRIVALDDPGKDPWERRLEGIRRDNVELMYVSRFVHFDELDVARATNAIRKAGGVAPLSTVAGAIKTRRVEGRAVCYSMMAHRIVSIDIDRPLDDRSLVRAVPPAIPPPD